MMSNQGAEVEMRTVRKLRGGPATRRLARPGYAAPAASAEGWKEKPMKRHVHSLVLALVAFAPLAAQAPPGWKMRVDRSTEASDPDASGDIKFVTMGSGFQATNPKAAVYWNPANTASGSYTLKGTFTLMKPSG